MPTLIEAIRLGLDEALGRDERVILLGEDIGLRGGIYGATQGLYHQYGPQRVIDFGRGAAAIVGAGIGAALYGMRPVCEIPFADAIFPAFNQIANEAARMYYRSQGAWNVPLVIRAPYGGGLSAGLYHSQSVEAYFAHIPGLKVVVPSSPSDARGLLAASICDPNPVLFLEPKRGYRQMEGELSSEAVPVPLGAAQVTRPGRHLTAISYGQMHAVTLQAAERLSQDELEVEVIDLRTLHPLDQDTLLDSVRKTGRALIIYEDNLTGGYGAEIAARLAAEAFSNLKAPIQRIAGPDIPAVPFHFNMQAWYLPNVNRVVTAMRALAAA